MSRRLESLALAFAKMNGALDPQSEAFKNRNPSQLLAFNPKHERDAKGRRVFKHFIAGFENAVLDARIKCSGKSRSKLTPESPLVELCHTYGHPTTSLKYIINFLRHALEDDTIPQTIHLGWFLEDEDNGNTATT